MAVNELHHTTEMLNKKFVIIKRKIIAYADEGWHDPDHVMDELITCFEDMDYYGIDHPDKHNISGYTWLALNCVKEWDENY